VEVETAWLREEEARRHRKRASDARSETVDGLFDDTEPDEEPVLKEEDPAIEASSSFRRYVSEGITLLEEWLRDPE
jgi:hypothetical protein